MKKGELKILLSMGCNYSLMSQGGQLQPELNGVDMLFQLNSTIPGIRMSNSTHKSRIGSSTLTATEKEEMEI